MMSTNSLSKSGTFLLKKYPSMELLETSAQPTTNIPKKTFSFEFPTSPEPSYQEEIVHISHQQHPLAKMTLPDLFTCTGCKEYGAGKRFACQQCDFQLHEFCALSPPSLNTHPLHGQHQLLFRSKSKSGGIGWPSCDVCGKATKGFTFRCSACSFQMHPCCAMLSTQVNFSIHPHSLKLLPAMTASSGESGFVCGECKRKRSGRVYGCTVCCDYHLHAVCAKDMINGLQANGIKGPVKPSMLGAAARVASLVIVEFIGGLIDGIGEGVGQAIVQNIRGRCVGSNRRRRETPTIDQG
ncbi:protein VACUOLELESS GAMETOPHYTES [Rhododendron vialii]|uniref:protein VACUOLELESS GAMETOPHYTES n=1 Tax=Rhododendron vialii TaxID=182163 RepID=UPI00265EA96C|nr:protein VACUOLELESS GAMETOPHYTES [Rhododendron vialii]